MKFEIAVDAKKHDEFVNKSPLNHLLQSSTWAKVKDNWASEIVGVTDDSGELIASSLVLIKKLPLGFTMFYTPRGPIMDYKNAALVTFFFDNLKKFAKKQHALFIKIDPAILYRTSKFGSKETAEIIPESLEIIKNIKTAGGDHLGFNMVMGETIQPRFQANEPLRTADEMDKIYPKHAKRIMKDAVNRGVVGRRVGMEKLQNFSDVVSMTESRKGVALRNSEYFKQLMTLYGEDAYLHLAEVNLKKKYAELQAQHAQIEKDIAETPENQKKRFNRLNDQKKSTEKYLKEFENYDTQTDDTTVIAGILSIKFGDTMEMLYAGMNDDFKKFYPQYLLYPQVFAESFADGANWANMGGVEGDLEDGLSKFKSNFNPDIQELIGEFNIPVNKVLYRLSNLAYKLRKKMR
ncbi:UDP-N-acetylmuramoylpentapeptide-lysine N(6)-alanyltransferase MurM [Lactococcus insecticola]|uniref:UDP-N-acetylmuramoylpentapeptide-lysine N(6)-alanyltransferase MurM n=2 Tax=Pseudolactococcus insecticola TaxID=2709158 RepID=A0A6A0B4V6_9LACT|nr:UDP-N-acetylmuramoylpentapeptide-lysine N(6)-alanyltransferase MurM [Lactococcus insecticola]